MNDDKRIIDIICDSLLPLSFLILVIICIVCCFTLPVHAATDQDFFPMEQNKNGKFSSTDIANIETVFDSVNNYIIARYHHTNAAGTKYVRVLYFPKDNSVMLYGEIFSNLHQFSVYRSGSGNVRSQDITLSGNTLTKQGSVGTNYFNDFTGVESSNYSIDYDYVSNFQLYTNNNPDTRKIVLLYGSQEPVIPEDDTIPEDADKPSLSDYLPEDTIPPTFDNSTVEAALGSIFNYLLYETNKITGTISGIGEYVSDSLMWGLQMVINNIRSKIVEMTNAIGDKIDDVKTGIGSVVDNIEDFFDYIKEPVDKQAVESALEGTSLYSLSSIGFTIKTTFSNYFDSIPQPDTLSFTIPFTILTKTGNIVVDFSWYANIRSSVLPWIVGFLYAGFGLAIFRSIPSIIHGVSGVLQKGG